MIAENENLAKSFKRLEDSVMGRTARLSDDETLTVLLSCFYDEKAAMTVYLRLQERFSTFSEVIDAPLDELRIALGSERVAYYLKMIPLLSKYYRAARARSEKPLDIKSIAAFCSVKLCTDMRESFHLILLDSDMHMLGAELIAEGDGCSVEAKYQRIAEGIFGYGASAYVLAHNHPSGNLHPSANDIRVTSELYSLFAPFGVRMAEHLIIAHNKYLPIMHIMRKNGMDLEPFATDGEFYE